MRKKRILIHSNYSRAFTGFGKNMKNILRYLFSTEKYEIMELANGKGWDDADLSLQPWRAHGSLPDANTFAALNPHEKRAAGYGSFGVDKAIEEFRPDIYLGIEDIWAFEGYNLRPWWNKLTPMIWTTLDSLPILDMAIDMSPSLKHYYVWASFAEKNLSKLGYNHIKTLHGAIETNHFFRHDDEKRKQLRQKFGLDDSFVIGFVFRNQLRKSVPNLLQGFKQFLKTYSNAKLLLHTSWEEGWDIEKLIKEHDISVDCIYTTYVCGKCKEMVVSPFRGKRMNCPHCKTQNSLSTTSIGNGVSEAQLNDVYNLMDVYCHPFTSGGQELPIQEAKLTELITLVTNYSCGEDSCSSESGGLPLTWSEYREPGTQFIKASTNPDDIMRKLTQVFNMSEDERKCMGQKAREFVLNNYAIDVIGARLEKIFDDCPFVNDQIDLLQSEANPDFEIEENLTDDQYIISLHSGFLNEKIDQNHSSFKFWMKKIPFDGRDKIKLHFKNAAIAKIKRPLKLSEMFPVENKNSRIAIVVPQSATDVLLINSLSTNLQAQYPDCELHVFTHPSLFPFIEDNPSVFKCHIFDESLMGFGVLEGAGDHHGYFKHAFFPTITTQDKICYIHNGTNQHQFSLT